MTTLLSCKGLSKDYRGASVLRDLSFSLDSGQAMLVTGPNGTGKTTLLSILAGLVQASSGEIRLGGEIVDSRTHRVRRKIGFLPASENSLFLNATARENLAFWSELQGCSANQGARFQALAEQWGFSAQLNRPVREISSGFRRRVALARAFLHEPELVLLDEPLAFLDEENQERVLTAFENWLTGKKRTLLVTSNIDFRKGGSWKSLHLDSKLNRVSAQ